MMENVPSRNAERNTGKYPDVVVAVSRLKKSYVTSFVLDCEIVAYDCEKQKILPFQVNYFRTAVQILFLVLFMMVSYPPIGVGLTPYLFSSQKSSQMYSALDLVKM
ncbi:uncharacterized protein LOC125479461 isoform X1 [Pyrus x bretschneideri]|uniref:uncharacterized protein LOC125479461 isoform X1 n=1 Tax=Pyrus x bretschneideri TaxID=225117 RepID=UPI00203045D5|nr:uncharacterized protein LOC125479461 isoform X1 [Pyrus x bretschneideri]